MTVATEDDLGKEYMSVREGRGQCLEYFFFFKQKTAYEIYQCDWSSDVCSSDLPDIRKELIDLGLDRSKQFSWEKCAKQTLEYIVGQIGRASCRERV